MTSKQKILITGGAGFIGSNACNYFLEKGSEVVVVDNLSRLGTRNNLDWIQSRHRFKFLETDLRNFAALETVFRNEGPFDAVLHLAGQVAVTTSVTDPRTDFEINALGTFNVLEAIRLHSPDSAVIFSSTNKVYGELNDMRVEAVGKRYTLPDKPNGVGEDEPLCFHSPYGCSKGAADQYVLDYSRIYGIRAVSLRQSCIYGYRQFGMEDQGWVAWFTIRAQCDMPVTIFGDGLQVRDVLFIDDLVSLYDRAIDRIDEIAGRPFNAGGGPQNTLSLLELVEQLDSISGRKLDVTFSDWRPGDQKVFCCDLASVSSALDWTPKVDPKTGVERLYQWCSENGETIENVLGF